MNDDKRKKAREARAAEIKLAREQRLWRIKFKQEEQEKAGKKT